MTPVASRPATHKDSAKAEKVLKKAAPVAKPVEENNGSTKGIKWGLNLHATFRRLLEENFKAKKTDEELMQFLLAEFPNRENKNILYNIREIRWRYNFGKLHLDKDDVPHAPEKQSVRYMEDGSVYEKKTAKPKLTEEEKAAREAERKEKAVEHRAEMIESVEKAEERLEKLRTKLAEHIEKYGDLSPKKVVTGKKVVVKKSPKG